MIVKPKKDYGLMNIEYEGDKFKYLHGQDIDETLMEVQELKENQRDGGWNESRTQRHIARIPDIEFLRHPEWMHDSRLILKWLETPEGSRYVTNKVYTGRSGHVRVK